MKPYIYSAGWISVIYQPMTWQLTWFSTWIWSGHSFMGNTQYYPMRHYCNSTVIQSITAQLCLNFLVSLLMCALQLFLKYIRLSTYQTAQGRCMHMKQESVQYMRFTTWFLCGYQWVWIFCGLASVWSLFTKILQVSDSLNQMIMTMADVKKNATK